MSIGRSQSETTFSLPTSRSLFEMRLIVLGSLVVGAAAGSSCPLSHRFSFTSDGASKCCAVNLENDDCPGESINCPIGNCEDWENFRYCPASHPFVYRPMVNRDYCCTTPHSQYSNEANGKPDYSERANTCKSGAFTPCNDSPCSDEGRFGMAVHENTGYLGCYESDNDMVSVGNVGTIAECKSLAVDAGKPYFGLQNGTNCLVGDSYGASGKASETQCRMECNGDSNMACGGDTEMSVYNTNTFVRATCRINMDNKTHDVYADGVRIPFVGTNSHNGYVTIHFPATVKRLAVRTSDNENHGLDSGGFSLTCWSDDTTSKWHLFSTTPYFLEYARGRSDLTVDASRTIPIDWTNPNYDLNSAPAEWEFKPLWYRSVGTAASFLGKLNGSLTAYPTIDYRVKPQEYLGAYMMVFEPLDANGSIIPRNEMSAIVTPSNHVNHLAHAPEKCIDGIFTSTQGSNLCHSDGNNGNGTSNPTLTIDTGKERFFQSVKIYNRNDSSTVSGRLGRHEVWISNTANFDSESTAFLCSEKTVAGVVQSVTHRCPSNVSGRFVHVRLPGNNRILNLVEVVVSALKTEQKFEFRRYDSEDGRGGTYLFQDTSIADHHFEFTAKVTTGATPADEEAKLLSRGNCDSDSLNKDLITFRAGSFELKVEGTNTGTVLDPSTEYLIQLERVSHEGADYLKLWVGDSMVYEAPTSMIDILSNTPTKGMNERHGKSNWTVGAGYCDAEDSETLVNYGDSSREYSNSWSVTHESSKLNSSRAWSTKTSSSAGSVDTLTIDQGSRKTVVGFTVQARHDYTQYVSQLKMWSSDDKVNWSAVGITGQYLSSAMPAWAGDVSSAATRDRQVTRYVKAATARYIKIQPTACYGHCSLRIGLNVVEENWNAFNFHPFPGVVENAELKLTQEAGTYNVKSLTAEPTYQPTVGNMEDLECADANEITFATYYNVVATNYHIPLDSQNNAIDFSARGPDPINMALLPSGTNPSDVSEGYTGGYEIFIGDWDEPYAHVSGTFGGVPDAIANLHDEKTITTKEMRDYSVAISGSIVTIYYGHSHESTKEVLLTHDFGTEKAIGFGLVSYGYGDLECKEKVTSSS